MGPPVQFLSALVDTSSLDKAFSLTFNSGFSTTFSVAVSPAQGIEAQTIWTVTLLVVLYIPRFMRLWLQTYAADLVPISPSGAGTLRKAFGGIYQLRPAVVVSGVIGALSLPYIYFQTNLITGAATLLYLTISNVIVSLVFGTIIWVYFRSLWGLYKFGKEPLKLMTHDEDPMLGVRPIGSISLSLFLSYILVIGFGGLELVLSPDPVSLSLLLVLALLGGFMFFLPLNSMHKKMLAEKRGGRKKLDQALSLVSRGSENGGDQKAEDLLRSIRDVQVLQMQREILSSVPTWPFDTGILGRFAAVILTVIGILLSRVIYNKQTIPILTTCVSTTSRNVRYLSLGRLTLRTQSGPYPSRPTFPNMVRPGCLNAIL